METKHKGVISVIIAAFIFGCMPLMANLVYMQGSNALSLVFYRFFFALPFLYILVRKSENETLRLTKEEFKKIIIVGIFGYTGTGLTLFMSYSYIPSGMATAIHFIYPMFVVLACLIFFKEKTSWLKLVSLILSILGIMTFYEKGGGSNFIGILLAFISGITYAFYTVYVDKSGLKEMNTFKLSFYLCLIASIVMFIFSISTNSFTMDIKPFGWFMAVVLSLSVGLGGVNLYQFGIKTIGPQSTAILSTFEPITSLILGIVILNEDFGFKTILGILFIVLAVILVSIDEK